MAPNCKQNPPSPDRGSRHSVAVRHPETGHRVEDLARQFDLDLLSLERSTSHGPRNRLEGRSGYKHQIDASVDLGDRLFIYECKSFTDKSIGLSYVLTLLGRLVDLQAADTSKTVTAALITNSA